MADYTNANAPVMPNPINLDLAITNIQLKLSNLPWLETSYGRAFNKPNKDLDITRQQPHVYVANGEYKKVLANDNLQALSFIFPLAPERVLDWEPNQKSQNKEVDIAIIFWIDLRKIDPNTDNIYIETLKKDIEGILNFCAEIQTINRIYDDRARDVFREFDISELTKEKLMYPFVAMRYECTISYQTFCE